MNWHSTTSPAKLQVTTYNSREDPSQEVYLCTIVVCMCFVISVLLHTQDCMHPSLLLLTRKRSTTVNTQPGRPGLLHPSQLLLGSLAWQQKSSSIPCHPIHQHGWANHQEVHTKLFKPWTAPRETEPVISWCRTYGSKPGCTTVIIYMVPE